MHAPVRNKLFDRLLFGKDIFESFPNFFSYVFVLRDQQLNNKNLGQFNRKRQMSAPFVDYFEILFVIDYTGI